MSSPEMVVEVTGRFARDALAAGAGEVCAVFKRSFYVRVGKLHACIGDASLGRGPLNALVGSLQIPAMGERVQVSIQGAALWKPTLNAPNVDLAALKKADPPADGLGCLAAGKHNSLTVHAQPALEALDRWLEGHTLDQQAEGLIGLGPGLTPSGDDYLGGVLVALLARGRDSQAQSLWRWLEPRLGRTSELSGAHLSAAAQGEAHEALHAVLDGAEPTRLDGVGHCSGWDALAGAVAVLKTG